MYRLRFYHYSLSNEIQLCISFLVPSVRSFLFEREVDFWLIVLLHIVFVTSWRRCSKCPFNAANWIFRYSPWEENLLGLLQLDDLAFTRRCDMLSRFSFLFFPSTYVRYRCFLPLVLPSNGSLSLVRETFERVHLRYIKHSFQADIRDNIIKRFTCCTLNKTNQPVVE